MAVPPEVEELIADAPLSAHLASAVADRPHVAPVWYAYRDGTLSVLTGGKKLANVRENSQVAVSIERAREGSVEWMATLLGTATVTEDAECMQEARNRIYPKYEGAEYEADGSGEESDGALVEIEIGPASAQRY